jgi:hypothetical protein
VARLPDRETAAKTVPVEASTLSLAELPRQEGSPMYQPSSLANRRNPSAARDARVTYARLPCQRVETLRQSEQPN